MTAPPWTEAESARVGAEIAEQQRRDEGPYERTFRAIDGSGRSFQLTIWPDGEATIRIKSGDRWGSPVPLEEVVRA